MRRAPLVLLVGLALPTAAYAVVGVSAGKHNLSASGTGTIKSSQTEICVFCHPSGHGGRMSNNRPDPTASYTPYNSTTLVSPQPGQPSGGTRVCLSCHDGTIAVGQTLGKTFTVSGTTGTGTLPTGASNLGVDLTKTHPVSFKPVVSSQLTTPGATSPVRYDGNGQLQCTSCHDPHLDMIDPVRGKFLVQDDRYSGLCTTCHAKAYWRSNPSSHQSSTLLFNSPARHTPYLTVAENACEACHTSHASATTSRLLTADEPAVCLGSCHTTQVAAKNISADFAKDFNHPLPVGAAPRIHDAAEYPGSPNPLPEIDAGRQRHVTCSDCHNAHAAFVQAPAGAGRVSGFLSGVWGVDQYNNKVDPAQYEYEICFKCHAASMNQPQRTGATPPEAWTRAFIDVNLSNRFAATAASFHPVVTIGKNPGMPGLLAPWTTASIVKCSDCHASDSGPGAGGTGPSGPHGSTYPHILEREFSTADHLTEAPALYALCYKCHDRTKLLSGNSGDSGFTPHMIHVTQTASPTTAPTACSTCHDWHGVSTQQGTATNNAHLIYFDTSIVKGPGGVGNPVYTSLGVNTGKCDLKCHNYDHVGKTYVP